MSFPLFVLLLIPQTIDPSLPEFTKILDGHDMSSGLLEREKWLSHTQKYCFLSQELQFDFTYEFSPLAIPAFTLKNSDFDLFLTVDIDPIYPIKFQKIADAWKKISLDKKNERICFEGNYLPRATPKDSSFIMVSKIRTKENEIITENFVDL